MFRRYLSLRTTLHLMFLGVLGLRIFAASAAPPDADALLKQSDQYRNGWPSYVLRVKITTYSSGKPDEEKLYEVSQKGEEKTFIEFLSPREKGEHLLMLGDDMWLYLPTASRPLRITPLERLTGNASNGDVARTRYADDYTAVYVRSEKVGTEDCNVLELTAKRKGATYRKIMYWLRVQDARPRKAEYYMASGKMFKSATFDEYAPVAGKLLLRRYTLYDEIHHNSRSIIEYSDITQRELPDKLFYQGRSDRY